MSDLTTASSAPIHSVVFITADVQNSDSLIANFGNDVQVFMLSPDQDGVLQMASILQGYINLDSIQIFSHGSAGTLFLGSTTLNNDNLSSYSDALTQIGTSLTATGDILLYGCDVAQGDSGTTLIA